MVSHDNQLRRHGVLWHGPRFSKAKRIPIVNGVIFTHQNATWHHVEAISWRYSAIPKETRQSTSRNLIFGRANSRKNYVNQSYKPLKNHRVRSLIVTRVDSVGQGRTPYKPEGVFKFPVELSNFREYLLTFVFQFFFEEFWSKVSEKFKDKYA